jgi:hypothetical protein
MKQSAHELAVELLRKGYFLVGKDAEMAYRAELRKKFPILEKLGSFSEQEKMRLADEKLSEIEELTKKSREIERLEWKPFAEYTNDDRLKLDQSGPIESARESAFEVFREIIREMEVGSKERCINRLFKLCINDVSYGIKRLLKETLKEILSGISEEKKEKIAKGFEGQVQEELQKYITCWEKDMWWIENELKGLIRVYGVILVSLEKDETRLSFMKELRPLQLFKFDHLSVWLEALYTLTEATIAVKDPDKKEEIITEEFLPLVNSRDTNDWYRGIDALAEIVASFDEDKRKEKYKELFIKIAREDLTPKGPGLLPDRRRNYRAEEAINRIEESMGTT